MTSVLLSIIGFILAIGILVIVHEGGHYLMAKFFHIRVKRFSLGMGPVLARRYRWDTEFVISLIPAGGYVAFAEKDEPIEDARMGQRGIFFTDATRWQRALVIVAGPVINFILAFVLLVGVGFLGVQDIASYTAAQPNSQAATQGVQLNDRIVAIDGEKIYGWGQVNTSLLGHLGQKDVPITLMRGHETITRHFDLSALTLQDAAKAKGFISTQVGLLPSLVGIEIVDVLPDSPAARAGILPQSKVIAINGETSDKVLSVPAFMKIIQDSPDQAIKLLLKDREDQRYEVYLRPAMKTDPKTGQVQGYVGIQMRQPIEMVTLHLNPLEATSYAYNKVVNLFNLQFKSVGEVAKGDVSVKEFSGPVGIASVAGSAVSAGLVPFLEFLALLSVALGFMNLIPIPALDGGQLVILACEGVLRRDLSLRFKNALAALSFALLMVLAVVVTFSDVQRLTG